MRAPRLARPWAAPALAALLVGLLASGGPVAQAQGHEHGSSGPTLIAHDGPADGRQVVGNLAHFAAIARGEDAVPDFHQDVPMRVTLNGRVLFETTPDSGHDYDGVNVIDVVFPEPGHYAVEALDASGAALATFAGEVVAAGGIGASVGSLEFLPRPSLGVATPFTYWVAPAGGGPDGGGPDGDALVPHSDCWFEVLRGGASLFRTKTHTHEERQTVEYAFQAPGAHQVRVTCFQAYPSARATLFAPIVQAWDVEVAPAGEAGVPAAPPSGAPGMPGTPPTELNAVVLGAPGGELLLVGTFDPYTVVGPDTLQHLAVLAVDPATGVPRQHVDFEATLTAPGGGVLFASGTLHEYDGIYELATRQPVPGVYTLAVAAEAGAWSDRIVMQWSVAPPAVPTSAGLVEVALEHGDAAAGAPADYRFAALASSGPFAHSEVELRVLGDGPVPLLAAKLHTHDDGTFPFRLGLAEGTHRLEADVFPLMPEAVVVRPAAFAVTVAPASASVPADHGGDAGQDAPGLGVALAAAAVAVALLARRRR